VGHHLREDVDRIADHDDCAAAPAEPPADIPDHLRVLPQQIQACLARASAAARGNHDGVCIGHVLDRRRPDGSRWIEGGALREVHRFPLGDFLAHVVEQELVRQAGMQRGDRDADAYRTGADDPDATLHAV
jgi:hypothetical protein